MANAPIIINDNIICPFCKNGKIEVLIMSGCTAPRTSRISGGKRTTSHVHRAEKIEIMSGCLICGKSKSEIKEAVRSGTSGKTHEERIARLKKAGIPTRIEG